MQWLSGRVLDLRSRGRRFKPHWCHCVVTSLSKNISPSLVSTGSTQEDPSLQLTDRLLMGPKESNQTNKLELLPLIYIENWFLCSILGIFFLPILFKLYI